MEDGVEVGNLAWMIAGRCRRGEKVDVILIYQVRRSVPKLN
jgi:hypothetical protein